MTAIRRSLTAQGLDIEVGPLNYYRWSLTGWINPASATVDYSRLLQNIPGERARVRRGLLVLAHSYLRARGLALGHTLSPANAGFWFGHYIRAADPTLFGHDRLVKS